MKIGAVQARGMLGLMDPAGISALLAAILHMHGRLGTWIKSVPVHLTHDEQTVWEGEVQVFELVGHKQAPRAYAWSHESGTEGRRRFFAVLEIGRVTNAAAAVQESIRQSISPKN